MTLGELFNANDVLVERWIELSRARGGVCGGDANLSKSLEIPDLWQSSKNCGGKECGLWRTHQPRSGSMKE